MPTPEIRIVQNNEALAYEAAKCFLEWARESIQRQGSCSVALSGGGTPRAVHTALAESSASSLLDWNRIWFFFGDERCIPPDHYESNFHMAQETLFAPLRIPSEHIFRMRGEAESPESAALDYETTIRTHFSLHPSEFPRFQLILLGLGEDGHIASLFPGSPVLQERRRLVVSSQSPMGIPRRISLTLPVINRAELVLFLVSGARKAVIVNKIFGGEFQNEQRLPAQLVQPEEGRVLWLLDREATEACPSLTRNPVIKRTP